MTIPSGPPGVYNRAPVVKTTVLKILSVHIIQLSVALSMFCACNPSEGSISRRQYVYYIDSGSGNDNNTGTSEDSPWSSLDKIEETRLNPGDRVCFRRGSEYHGPLYIIDSGDEENYITLTDYGDPGLPAPSFTNPVYDPGSLDFGNCIRLQGNYIIVENLFFHHTAAQLPSTTGSFTSMWELGAIHVDTSAGHCILRNNEFMDCGAGIRSAAAYVIIEKNYIHDCNRILKEWSWGPIGIWLGANHQEVRYNTIVNYSVTHPGITWGPDSYGGGADGGAIEIDDARKDKSDISIHHNYSRDCQGFLEVTWTDVEQNPEYTGFLIHHNISDDYQQFIALWRGAGCRIENNTIIRRKRNDNDWGVFNITQDGSKNFIRNNIVVVEQDIVVFNTGRTGRAKPQNIIETNLFYAASGSLIIGKEELESPLIGDPKFLNYGRGNSPGDFSITVGSPAINRGADLGYDIDFSGTHIPQEGIPDIGAYELRERQPRRYASRLKCTNKSKQIIDDSSEPGCGESQFF